MKESVPDTRSEYRRVEKHRFQVWAELDHRHVAAAVALSDSGDAVSMGDNLLLKPDLDLDSSR